MKRAIVLAIGLMVMSGRGVMAADIVWQTTEAARFGEIGRPSTYDYSPTAFEENGEKWVYVCGGGAPNTKYVGHDSVYLTKFNSAGQKILDSKMVVEPMINGESDDAVHACAPSVVKHSFGALDGGKEKYLMYYECGPKSYNKTTGARVEGFTQICVAYSDDGLNWKKYNESIWNSEYRFANMNEPATAVLKINPNMVTRYGVERINGKYMMNLTNFELDAYGVGHPSAIVVDNKIWVYYYDSAGDWGARGLFLVKSDDGFHFSAPVKIADIKSQGDVKYFDKGVLGTSREFMYIGNAFGLTYYNTSEDGIDWKWAEVDSKSFYTDYLANNFLLGKPVGDRCFVAGGNAFLSDKFGKLTSNTVEVLVGEGKMGPEDGCTATNGCTCYTSIPGRGMTWQTYSFKGKFSVNGTTTFPGDWTGDGKVGIEDFGGWKEAYLKGTATLVDFGIWKEAYLAR